MKFVAQLATPSFIAEVDDSVVVDVTGLQNVSLYAAMAADFAILDLSGVTTDVDTVIQAITPGAIPHIVLQPGAADGVGTIAEVGDVVTLTFKTTVTTVTQLEALIAQSTLISVLTPGTGTNVLDTADDSVSDTPLALGSATFTLDIEKSADGVNFSAVGSFSEGDFATANAAAELTLSDSHGMPTTAKLVRATLSALTGAAHFSLTAAGMQSDDYR